uniref:Mohawk homeobox a n=1 Tax=Cyprinodon variegatus TaxID=28743 RepID=A0A3Q2CZG7_CYPVA
MNTIVFNKLSSQVLFEEKAKEVEMSSRNYLEVIDGQHPDLLCSSPAIRDSQAVRHRRSGGSKVRHKRQALQDMARPLKQWLYKHRDNPYPTKTEKILLALGSQMTLVQVSNWFPLVNLKDAYFLPDLSWALRIKLYNKYVQGNAERLSVSSDDSCSEDGDNPQRTQNGPEFLPKPLYQSVIKKEGSSMVGVAIGMDPGLRSAVDDASLSFFYSCFYWSIFCILQSAFIFQQISSLIVHIFKQTEPDCSEMNVRNNEASLQLLLLVPSLVPVNHSSLKQELLLPECPKHLVSVQNSFL